MNKKLSRSHLLLPTVILNMTFVLRLSWMIYPFVLMLFFPKDPQCAATLKKTNERSIYTSGIYDQVECMDSSRVMDERCHMGGGELKGDIS